MKEMNKYFELVNKIISKKRFYYNELGECLFGGTNIKLGINQIISLDPRILNHFNKLEMGFSKSTSYKHRKTVLIIIGSFFCFKYYKLTQEEKILFLIYYFKRKYVIKNDMTIIEYDNIYKIFDMLASNNKLSYKSIYILKELLLIIPKCFHKQYCKVIYYNDFFHYVHNNEHFFRKFLELYPNYIFYSSMKKVGFLQQLSLSVINWNNNLIRIIYYYNINILLIIGYYFYNKDYKKSKEKNRKLINQLKNILLSTREDKLYSYLNLIKKIQYKEKIYN